MHGYIAELRLPQDVVHRLSEEDILPDDFNNLAPEDQTVALACLYARDTPLDKDATTVLNAVLVAWNDGRISGIEAMGALWTRRCLPFDDMLRLYLWYIRARDAADIEGRAA